MDDIQRWLEAVLTDDPPDVTREVLLQNTDTEGGATAVLAVLRAHDVGHVGVVVRLAGGACAPIAPAIRG